MSFKSLKAGLGVALRNTKVDFFTNATIDKIKSVQERWENSVDQKEQTYAKLLQEMERNNIHLPTEEEMQADLTFGLNYVKQQLTAEKAKAVLDLSIKTSKLMSDKTVKFIEDKFLFSEETNRLVDNFLEEEANQFTTEVEARTDAILRGKKPKKPKNTAKKSSQKAGKLVDPKTRKKAKIAKTFKRQGPAARAKLKDQLNAILERNIKENMGNSSMPSSKEYLRNQTGRFAASAEVDRVAPRTIFYSYQTRPYSVFDPSISHYRGLSSVGRNPRKIISDALRDSLYQLKVGQSYVYRQDHSL